MPEADVAYERIIADWLANGRTFRQEQEVSQTLGTAMKVSISDLPDR